MKKQNICKFITKTELDDKEVLNFVYEQNKDTMAEKKLLESNRASLITSGEVVFCVDGSEYRLAKGELFFSFCKEVVFAKPSCDAEYHYVDFIGERTSGLLKRFSVCKDNRHFRGFDGVIPLWRESLARADDDNIDLVAESMLLYVFSRLQNDYREKAGVINELIEYSEEHFNDPTLSLSSLAKELNYNTKYISHLFKKTMGIGYTEYLRMLRMKYATSLLDHGIVSIKNVALLSGFSDPLYFSTLFKRTVGISPKDYIQGKKEKPKD